MTLGRKSPKILESENSSSEKFAESGLDDNFSLGENFPTIFEDDKLDFDNFTISDVINFLQVQINDNIIMLVQIRARREREEAEIAENLIKESLLKFVPSNPLKKLILSVPMSILILLNMLMSKQMGLERSRL